MADSPLFVVVLLKLSSYVIWVVTPLQK